MHANMTFFASDDSSLLVTHLLYKAALIYTVLRWVVSWALRFKNRNLSSLSTEVPSEEQHSSPFLAAQLKSQMILSSFKDISECFVLPESCDVCAVCLTKLRDEDEVRQLRNCCHVFHKECIDKWVDHDSQNNHKACPLCRTPLLMQPASLCCPSSQPSWAVDRMLYLFGDDLYD